MVYRQVTVESNGRFFFIVPGYGNLCHNIHGYVNALPQQSNDFRSLLLHEIEFMMDQTEKRPLLSRVILDVCNNDRWQDSLYIRFPKVLDELDKTILRTIGTYLAAYLTEIFVHYSHLHDSARKAAELWQSSGIPLFHEGEEYSARYNGEYFCNLVVKSISEPRFVHLNDVTNINLPFYDCEVRNRFGETFCLNGVSEFHLLQRHAEDIEAIYTRRFTV